MLRTRLNTAHIKRTFRILYGWTQATPKSCFLDPAWNRSVNIFPGMGMARTSGENYTLVGPGMVPAGFSALYVGGDGIDEVLDAGINTFAVWVPGPDAEFEILAPAFDTTLSWVDAGDGSEQLVHVSTTGANRGKLVPAGSPNASTQPIARLLRVNSANKITLGGLR